MSTPFEASLASVPLPASGDRAVDVVVDALKALGGIGQIQEIVAQCEALGRPQPEPSIRRLLQENSSDAVWEKIKKPASAQDLFYSLDGVDKRTGFWGLRGYSIEAPDEYPIRGLTRAHARLYDRAETPLGKSDPRGIAYRNGTVEAVQVGFSPDSPYPDRLLGDGSIEHIGEGREQVQTDVGGNRGMHLAYEQGLDIPVFQAIGKKGEKRYAALGWYRVSAVGRRAIRFRENDFDTDAFVFLLKPSRRAEVATDEPIEQFVPTDHLRIEDVPIEQQNVERIFVSARTETEGLRRESTLVREFKEYAARHGRSAIRKRIIPSGETKALYTDIFINDDNILIEAKGAASRIAMRMALGQIADYRRYLNNPRCAILMPEMPSEDLLDLAAVERVIVLWPAENGFTSTLNIW